MTLFPFIEKLSPNLGSINNVVFVVTICSTNSGSSKDDKTFKTCESKLGDENRLIETVESKG